MIDPNLAKLQQQNYRAAMGLYNYEDIPWETFTLVEPAPIKRTRYSAFAGRVFIFLCAMAVVGGVLAAVN